MATLISFNTVEGGNYGVFRVLAKSGEKVKFPRPSELGSPKVDIHCSGKKAFKLDVNNIGLVVKFEEKNIPLEVMIRYQLR